MKNLLFLSALFLSFLNVSCMKNDNVNEGLSANETIAIQLMDSNNNPLPKCPFEVSTIQNNIPKYTNKRTDANGVLHLSYPEGSQVIAVSTGGASCNSACWKGGPVTLATSGNIMKMQPC